MIAQQLEIEVLYSLQCESREWMFNLRDVVLYIWRDSDLSMRL